MALGYDTLVTSEWGTPNMVENGLDAGNSARRQVRPQAARLGSAQARTCRTLDLGDEHQMALELRPAHDPTKAYGFVKCVVSLKDLSSSIWLWYRDGGKWAVKKVIEIPPSPPSRTTCRRCSRASRPCRRWSRTSISRSTTVPLRSCWGTGDLRQYDVSDPFNPRHTGSVRTAESSAATPSRRQERPLNGGPQMVEISRDGKRIYFTNSLYDAMDPQFYPGRHPGLDGEARRKAGRRHRVRPKIFVEWPRATAAPGPTRRRRLLVGLLLLSLRSKAVIGASASSLEFWPWLAVAGLGAFLLLCRARSCGDSARRSGHPGARRRRARGRPDGAFRQQKIRGHGIPEAIEAILLGRSRLDAKVAILKPLSSAIAIGTGGPFGAEGPIIMTGGAIGSLIAQALPVSDSERKTLLVAGAAAGMATVFGTPIAAIMLAVELLLFEWTPRSFIPVAVAAISRT